MVCYVFSEKIVLLFSDLNDLYPREESLSTIDNEENMPIQLPADTNKFMYVAGLIVALIVLLISLVINFVKGWLN